MENYDEAAGGLLVEHRMVAVTRPEVHTRIHPADNTGILAASLVASMKQEVARDPAAQISKKYNSSTNNLNQTVVHSHWSRIIEASRNVPVFFGISSQSPFLPCATLRISKLDNDFLLISR